MKNFEEQLLEHTGQAIDALMTADIHARGIIKPIFEHLTRQIGEPLSTFAAKGLMRVLEKPNAIVLVSTGFLVKPTMNPETDGPIAAALTARAVAILGGIPVIVAEEGCLPSLRVACRAAELNVMESVDSALKTPGSVVLTAMPPCAQAAEAERVMAELLALSPAAMIDIEHPGKGCDGKYYSAMGYVLEGWPGPVDDLFEKVRAQGGFTIGIGDLGNEIGMGFARPAITEMIPYGGLIATEGTCDAPIIACISEYGAYGLFAALTFISGKDVLPSPDLVETVLRAAVTGGAICGCNGVPTPSIDMIDVEYVRAYVQMLRCAIVYSRKFASSRPFFVEFRRGAALAEPGAYKGGHAR